MRKRNLWGMKFLNGMLMIALAFGLASCTKEDNLGDNGNKGNGTEQGGTGSEDDNKLPSFDNPKGVFILNEGNMTTENGSLTYISEDGKIWDDAYKTVNETELGNVAQDMAFYNGKIYVISQNGNMNATGVEFENDGMLVIMDGKTLKKEASFSKDELAGLDWPTHITVLDEQHVYIRDNNGIHRFNTETKELTLIDGTEGAPKAQFVTMNGKIYTFINKSYLCSILEISKENDSAVKINLPDSAPYKSLYGIAGSEDGNIWLTATGFGKEYTGKFYPATQELVSRQISVSPNIGSAGVAFVAKGNEIYYTNGTAIYKQTFDENSELDPESGLDAEEMLVDLSEIDNNAGLIYNGLGIHPVTGHVYANTIKGFAQYTTNQIWEFDFSTNTEKPVNKYENYTNFPAGFFFYPQASEQ